MATRQEVILKGLTNSPSDYDCQDGELATCLNLINEDGALHPIHQPVVAEQNITLDAGDTIELVHKVTHDEAIHSHYIIRKSDDTWYWMEKGGDGTKNTIDLNGFHVNAVTAVGNILSFVGDSKTMYAYWKDNGYILMDFSMIKYAGIGERENGNKTYDVIEPNDTISYIDDHNADKGNHYIKFKDNIDGNSAHKLFLAKDAALNKKMNDESFKYIQFGVLALKLYDGSHILVGNPFTITNGEGVDNNINLWYAYEGNTFVVEGEGEKFTSTDKTNYAVFLKQSLFKYRLKIIFSEITKYEDIIDGVDVFVSNSIYPYKTNVNLNEEQKKATGESTEKLEIETEEYGSLKLRNILTLGTKECLGHWSYPSLSKDEFNEEVSNLTFYKSISFTYDDVVNKKEKYLKRILETEESISVASSFRDSLGAKCAFTYNNRLHLANVSTTNRSIVNGYVSNQKGDAKVITHIKYKYNGNTLESYGVDNLQFPLDPILAFPNDNVISYEVYVSYAGAYYHKVVKTYSKNNLGLSFYAEYDSGKLQNINEGKFDPISSVIWNQSLATAKAFQPADIYSPSLIKVSEVENPLVFPAQNSVQVGSSIINALAANTRPISEGQFGDAPLYAFTDEGVWVLMLGEEGTYIARQPANRDICSNPKSILQIDDAVLYPTERGIMMQRGRESESITDVLDDYPFDFLSIYSHSTRDKTYPSKLLALGNIPESDVKYVRFRKYLEEVGLIYDYYDSRIIVFNPNYTYAYVYSLKSNLWGTMHNVFNKRVNIYPEAYATDKDGKILNVYVKEPTENVPFFLCSRPLTLGQDANKTMFDCITRGYFSRIQAGKCGTVLFGSNDLTHWYYVGSSINMYLRNLVGSPYKYFRFALMGSLDPNESISALSTEFQPRLQNKLR